VNRTFTAFNIIISSHFVVAVGNKSTNIRDRWKLINCFFAMPMSTLARAKL
jgi:hypothetical protein